MKKLVLLLAAAVAMTASAGNFTTNTNFRSMKKVSAMHPERVVANHATAAKEAKAIAPILADVIDNQPEGELKTYNRAGGAFVYDSYYGLSLSEQSGEAYIVWGEGNKVYFKDPVFGLAQGSWVEGTVNEAGTEITVPLGQTLYDSGEGYTLDLCWMSTNYEYPEDGDGQTVNIVTTVDERVTEAVYTIDGDVISLQGTEGDINAEFPECAVMTGLSACWSDDLSWQGCVDYGTVYTERETTEALPVITEQPEGELVEFIRSGECIMQSFSGMMFAEQEGKAYVVYGTDGKVYLQDPIYGAATGAWVEGTLSEDGNTITVPMGQCVVWNDEEEYGLILKMVDVNISEEGTITYAIDDRATEVTYTIDGDRISINDTYGDMNAAWPVDLRGLCGIWNDDLSFSGYMDWNTVYNKLVIKPAVPADPRLDVDATGYAEAWYDCGDESGYSKFYHAIILEDVDGNPIDEDRVTYSIFTDDDQIFTFPAADYSYDLEEDMTEIPLTGLYGYDLTPTTTYFYRTNAPGYEPLFTKRIGIQVYYTVDGVKNASNIVYYTLPTYGDGVPANPTADEWYDCGDESGYSKFYYTINTNTVDGEPMDPNRIYYSIFTDDDQLFTFDAYNYGWDIAEDMTMIPYKMSGIDIHNYMSYFYRTNAEGYEPFFNHQIGIQVYYVQNDGNIEASDIIYLEVFEPVTGVDEVAAGKTVANTRYFNMAGQEMREANGICIAVTTYTDGTTSAVKVVK